MHCRAFHHCQPFTSLLDIHKTTYYSGFMVNESDVMMIRNTHNNKERMNKEQPRHTHTPVQRRMPETALEKIQQRTKNRVCLSVTLGNNDVVCLSKNDGCVRIRKSAPALFSFLNPNVVTRLLVLILYFTECYTPHPSSYCFFNDNSLPDHFHEKQRTRYSSM